MAKKTGKNEKTAAEPAYENPLMPNPRLRQMYRSMLRARMLERTMPRPQRTATAGREACLVSTSIDLGPADLIADALAGAAIEFLRGAPLASVMKPGARKQKSGTTADCGAALHLPAQPGGVERVWTALGAAAALKALADHAKAQAQTQPEDEDAASPQQAVVVAYALPGEIAPALWRKALAFAAKQMLPIVFVILPPEQTQGAKPQATKVGNIGAISLGCGVPAIAVDADDAVAIYRVAQESVGHARIGGGAALIECVPYALAGAKGRSVPAVDAITGLGGYILQRGVATTAWIEAEKKSFARSIAKYRQAAK
jgi:TPP-dependent pyruvate/acetoin dehydrogenase alpha subunit